MSENINGDGVYSKVESTNLLRAKIIFCLAIRGRSVFSYLLPSRRG